MELRYDFPLWKKVIFFIAGGLVGAGGVGVIALLHFTHGIDFLPWAISYIVVATLLIGYAEAWHVQRRYAPSKA